MSVVIHFNSLTLLPTPGPLIRLPGPVLPGNKGKRSVGGAPTMNPPVANTLSHCCQLQSACWWSYQPWRDPEGSVVLSATQEHCKCQGRIDMHKVCCCTFMRNCNRRQISCHRIVLLQLVSQGVFEFGVKLLSSHPRNLQFTAFANFRNSGFQATFSTSVFLNSFVFLPGESRAHRKPSTLATSSSGTCQSQ